MRGFTFAVFFIIDHFQLRCWDCNLVFVVALMLDSKGMRTGTYMSFTNA